eukprot:m.53456 g.53456  ORF g.53456 m.53456 type:complete len:77 (-) comp48581_c0_seq2:519-749(-)
MRNYSHPLALKLLPLPLPLPLCLHLSGSAQRIETGLDPQDVEVVCAEARISSKSKSSVMKSGVEVGGTADTLIGAV